VTHEGSVGWDIQDKLSINTAIRELTGYELFIVTGINRKMSPTFFDLIYYL
jgi:hypothetical protein